ncbi:MAG: CARDB domain-containing protein [Kiloniellaceae bacterium]
MFKKLILASATAAVALTAVADFSAGTFDLTGTAEAQTAQPGKPARVGPAIPGTPDDLKSTQTDLFPTPLFPQGHEGQPGQFYCAGHPNQKPTAVSVVVNSQGTKAPGQVVVLFEFSGGKKVRQTVVLNSPNDAKGAAAYIPDSAWNGGKVGFTIRVDYQNKIPETNENNNVVQSFCLDPSF